MDCGKRQHGFTLIELLVVIAIIALLVSLLVPSLSAAREMARKSKCLTNLHAVGAAGSFYLHENGETYWGYFLSAQSVYWDGMDSGGAIDTKKSPFMKYLDNDLARLWCPCQPWGSYVPQRAVEPTTTYGYNQFCLDPGFGLMGPGGKPLPPKQSSAIKRPDMLFVFADSGLNMSGIYSNSHMIEGPSTVYGPNNTPTTQFRHLGQAAALCADSHAATFDLEGGKMLDAKYRMGFVGATNNPHYNDK